MRRVMTKPQRQEKRREIRARRWHPQGWRMRTARRLRERVAKHLWGILSPRVIVDEINLRCERLVKQIRRDFFQALGLPEGRLLELTELPTLPNLTVTVDDFASLGPAGTVETGRRETRVTCGCCGHVEVMHPGEISVCACRPELPLPHQRPRDPDGSFESLSSSCGQERSGRA